MLKTILAAAVAALTVIGSAAAQTAPPIKIGYALAKTGLFAAAAKSQIDAYELWREQVNAKGGLDVAGTRRMIEFVSYDDQSNPANTVKDYEKLITDDKVELLLAPWGTPMHFALAPLLERYGFPMVGNTAASVQIRDIKPGNLWFTTSAVPDKMAVEIVKLAKENNVKSAAILANVLPLAKEIKSFLIPELKKAGIKLVVNEDYPPDIKDMTAMLTEVKREKPQAVFVLSYPEDTVLYSKQAKEIGIDAPLQWLVVGPAIPFYRQMFGASAEGVVTMGHWSPARKEWPRAKPFYDAWVKKYHEEPDYLDSVLGYMSCEILEQAVAKAGTDHAKLRHVISTETFQTINGPVKFKGVENVITPTSFLQIQHGTLQLIWPKSIATAPFEPKKGW